MTDKDDVARGTPLEVEISEGIKADHLITGMKPYFLAMKGQLIQGFENTKFTQSQERDEIWRQLKAVNSLEKSLEIAIQTGKMAQETTNT